MDANEVEAIARRVAREEQAESLRRVADDLGDNDERAIAESRLMLLLRKEADDRLAPPAAKKPRCCVDCAEHTSRGGSCIFTSWSKHKPTECTAWRAAKPPADPPLPDESKLPQYWALSDKIRVPVLGKDYWTDASGEVFGRTGDRPDMESFDGRRYILAKRPSKPPAGHVHWDRKDGGGLREWREREWVLLDNGKPHKAEVASSRKRRWLLSPEAPPGHRHLPEADGGGYRPWKEGDWYIDNEGKARRVGPTDYTPLSYWIITPDTPSGVMLVEHAHGTHFRNRGEYRLVDGLTPVEYTRLELTVLTPAQVAAAMASKEGE